MSEKINTAFETDDNYVKPGEASFNPAEVKPGDAVFASTNGSDGVFLVASIEDVSGGYGSRIYKQVYGHRLIDGDGKPLVKPGKKIPIYPKESAHVWMENQLKRVEERRTMLLSCYEVIYKAQNKETDQK